MDGVTNEDTAYVPNTMVKGLGPAELMEAYRVRQMSDNPYDKNAVAAGYNGPRYVALSLSDSVLTYELNHYKASAVQNAVTVDYKGPRCVAQYLADSVSTSERKDYKILDVGAGTGLVAECLHRNGFRNIDALDPCEHMLQDARSKGLYRTYHVLFLTGESTGIAQDSYDAIVSNGCFVENHLQMEALNEMIRLVKPGGYIVIGNRSSCLYVAAYKGNLESYMDKLEAEGKWTRLTRGIIPDFYLDCEGTIWTYKIS